MVVLTSKSSLLPEVWWSLSVANCALCVDDCAQSFNDCFSTKKMTFSGKKQVRSYLTESDLQLLSVSPWGYIDKLP